MAGRAGKFLFAGLRLLRIAPTRLVVTFNLARIAPELLDLLVIFLPAALLVTAAMLVFLSHDLLSVG